MQAKFYILFTLAQIHMVDTFIGRIKLEEYIRWNDVPTEIPLGLLSNSPNITRTSLVNGTCFRYEVRIFERCKFYSDCCAMTPSRPLEQLAANTFSCHDGYYIVDRCPPVIRLPPLRKLCETSEANDTDISLRRWPVLGAVNHVSYKNIYCAICNGIEPTENVHIGDRIWFGDPRLKNATIPAVTWWPARVTCEAGAVEQYVKDNPTHKKLINLIRRACTVSYIPPRSPDLCWDAVRTCPNGADTELKTLCETGPANYINITTVNRVYRNQFCALCHDVELTMFRHPNLKGSSNIPFFHWSNGILKHRPDDTQNTNSTVLMVAAPVVYTNPQLGPSHPARFNSPYVNLLCSYFSDTHLDFCTNFHHHGKTFSRSINIGKTAGYLWNLGSIACSSNYQQVCDMFLVSHVHLRPGVRCSRFGCGGEHIIDPQTLICVKMSNIYHIVEIVREYNDLPWPSQAICNYQSRCKSVELGLMKEHELNCFCDKFCIYYNDCCDDSPYQATKETRLEEGTYFCQKDSTVERVTESAEGYEWGVMQVNKCPKDYRSDGNVLKYCNERNLLFRSILHPYYVPVTSNDNGLRYANLYCARCHGQTEVLYWQAEVGCIDVANSDCALPSRVEMGEEFYNLTESLRNDPSPQLLTERCRVKQYLPPKEKPAVRRCRYDATQPTISSCPAHMKYWRLAKLCLSSPTSFVYDGGNLSDSVRQNLVFKRQFLVTPTGSTYETRETKYKFRNSYCASCHSPWALGCHFKGSFQYNSTDKLEAQQFLTRYEPRTYMFVYRIDFNARSCHMDSDTILLYSNNDTGFDTCKNISDELKKCGCREMLELRTGTCVSGDQVRYNNQYCLNGAYNSETFTLSRYGKRACGPGFTYTPLADELAHRECRRCSANSTGCVSVYDMSTRPYRRYDSIHCLVKGFVGCRLSAQTTHCSWLPASSKQSSAPPLRFGFALKFPLQNALSIEYIPTIFRLDTALEMAFVNKSAKVLPTATCDTYAAVNQSSGDWLICRDKQLYSLDTNSSYHFLLRSDELIVCMVTEATTISETTTVTNETTTAVTSQTIMYGNITRAITPTTVIGAQHSQWKLQLAPWDYIIVALSICFIVGYAIYYFGKARRSIIKDLVIGCLISLSIGLVGFCLLHQTSSYVACRAIASCIQYIWLTVHFWTNAIGIRITRSMSSSLKRKKRETWHTQAKYAVYACASPLIFVGFTHVLDHNRSEHFYPVFDSRICMLATGSVQFILLLGPVCLLIVLTLFMSIVAAVKVFKFSDHLSSNAKRQTYENLTIAFKLQALLGLPWLLLLFSQFWGRHQTITQDIFKFALELQGALVVFSFLLTSKNLSRLGNISRRSASISAESDSPENHMQSMQLEESFRITTAK